MRFEHLVGVNDRLQPLLPELTRAQLWRGLVRRAERPAEFVLGLESATVHARSERGATLELARTLDFGSFQVRDRVALVLESESIASTEAGAQYAASRLTIRIEEPAPGDLFLRFTYESDEADTQGELGALTRQIREQAYRRADLDTVWRIRSLAERGELG